jgi:hypothetical protein
VTVQSGASLPARSRSRKNVCAYYMELICLHKVMNGMLFCLLVLSCMLTSPDFTIRSSSTAAAPLLQAYLVSHWAIMSVQGLMLPYKLFVCVDSRQLRAAGEAAEALCVEIEAQQR